MTKLASILIACLTLAGCLDDEEGLTSTEQEVESTGLTGLLTCTNKNGCDFPLGKDDGTRACFLAGIKGSLQGQQQHFISTGVSVLSRFGNFILRIVPGPSGTLSGSAVCVTNHHWMSFGQWNGGAATHLGNTPGQQCFLTSIESLDGFRHSSDQVSVIQLTDGSWRLVGTTGGVRAFANCIVPTGGSLWGYGWSWNNGTVTLPLAQNPGGVACALSKVQGSFTTAGDRISIGYNPQLVEWNMTLSGTSHTGGARCFD